VLRFGKKPQDFTGSQIEYFIPAQQIVVSQAAINAGDVKENKVEAPQNPEVKETEMPELNDDFAKDSCDTQDRLTSSVGTTIDTVFESIN